MTGGSTRHVERYERWSVGAFLVAGGFFVVFAAFWGAFAFTSASSEAVQDVVGPAGWTAAFVGLLGLYPRVGGGSGHLPRLAVGFAGLGCLGGVVTTVGNLAASLGLVGTLPAWVEALQLLLLLGIVFGFLSFALVVLRSGSEVRRLGLLLLLPAAIFVVNIVRVATLGSTTPVWSPFVLGSGQAVSLLAIGYTIRTVRVGMTGSAGASGPMAK